MKSLNSSASHLVVAILSTALSVTSPAWSDQERKPSVKKTATNSAADRKNDKSLDGQSKDLKDGKKEGGSIKKIAIKKVGAAATAGVATKKVTSTIKK